MPDLLSAITPNDTQHGFRSNRSTVRAMLPLVTTIARGFNEPKPVKHTGLLLVDLSKAFDVVKRDKLMKLNRTNLHPNLKRWFLSFMKDRKVQV